ncbi:hypothetical protein [Streptomyces scopuliridis]|uniref:hypothetical protein n=1 Tax=Streptomyces scopuliridis TaxID=452529 RepID=UPI0036A788D5
MIAVLGGGALEVEAGGGHGGQGSEKGADARAGQETRLIGDEGVEDGDGERAPLR